METSDYDEQEIIGQSLAAKSEVKEGDSITLYIPNLYSSVKTYVYYKIQPTNLQDY